MFGGASRAFDGNANGRQSRQRLVGAVDRAEGAVQGVDGLALEAEPYVGVDADVSMAQQVLDEDHS